MSIVALKRKTQAKQTNNSASQEQFSLNGPRRSQGWVGQDTLGRCLPKTPHRGNLPVGYGGHQGEYLTNTNVYYGTGVVNWNNSSVIKQSVVSTEGMLTKRSPTLTISYFPNMIADNVPALVQHRNHYTVKAGQIDGYDTYIQKLKQCVATTTKDPLVADPCTQTHCNSVADPSIWKRYYPTATIDRNTLPVQKQVVKNTQTKVQTYNGGLGYYQTLDKACWTNIDQPRFPRMVSGIPLPN